MSKFIGTGAAGNKAVINAINKGVIPRQHALLINSTLRDIPAEFHDISVRIGGDRGGCGKERDVAAELTIASLKDGSLDRLDQFLEPGDETVYIVSSTEGGSGSGSVPIIAKYFKEIYNINIHIIAFTGFEDDARSLRNTVEFFEQLSEDYVVQAISNKKFLNESNNNRLKAQQLANDEFVRRMSVVLGQTIVASENNIDETDLYKTVNTPGYITVEAATLDRNIKNKDQFNKFVSDMLDNSKSVDIIDAGTKRMAVILNVKESTSDNIDYNFEVIKQKYGFAFETFTHVQNEGDVEFINIILSGMNLPLEEITEIHEKYKESISKVNIRKDSFFETLSNIEKDNVVDLFNTAKRTTVIEQTIDRRKSFLDNISLNKSDKESENNNIEEAKKNFIDKY